MLKSRRRALGLLGRAFAARKPIRHRWAAAFLVKCSDESATLKLAAREAKPLPDNLSAALANDQSRGAHDVPVFLKTRMIDNERQTYSPFIALILSLAEQANSDAYAISAAT